MTVLPIVDRELRVAARESGTFWLRVGAALAGMLIQTGILLISGFGSAGASPPGDLLFTVVTWIALVAALSAGLFFTSDCLSGERREGTLGFLFLTDLRGYDVVCGKLLSTSLRSAYGLIAVCPIVAVALLFGAVSGMQLLKTVLALLNALFFSLAAGLWISSISRDSQRAFGATLVLLLALVLGGPVGDSIYSDARHRAFSPAVSLASPGYVFTLGSAWGRNAYWLALGVNQATAWGMLGLASLAVPRTWQQKRGQFRASRWTCWWKFGGERRRAAVRGRLLDRNPMLWLIGRERWQADVLWVLAVLALGVFVSMLVRGAAQPNWMIWVPIWYLSVPLFYLWTAAHAGRFFLDARRSGLLELLLTTPVEEAQIIRTQWVAILRSFGCPIALLLVVILACLCQGQFPSTALVLAQVGGTKTGWLLTLSVMAADVATVVAGLAALVWFAMWMGLTSRNAGLAALKSILFVKVIPWFVVTFLSALLSMVVFLPRMSAAGRLSPRSVYLGFSSGTLWALLMAWLPAGVNIAIDAGLIVLARQQMRGTLRPRAAGAMSSAWAPPRGLATAAIPSASATRGAP